MLCNIITKGTFEKDVIFPAGKWQDADGNVYEGNTVAKVASPLNKLLWFRRVK